MGKLIDTLQKILVLNAGSSSLKFKLFPFDPARGRVLPYTASGLVEKIGDPTSIFNFQTVTHQDDGQGEPKRDPKSVDAKTQIPDHHVALSKIVQLLQQKSIKNISQVAAVGHRVVHGGERFRSSVVIDETVLDEIRRVSPLAPLHNPNNLQGILTAMDLFRPNGNRTKHVAVFDTAFHATIPQGAFRYAIPNQLYKEHAIRRYGFHGTSYAYIVDRLAQLHMDKKKTEINAIVCHLGAGASVTCIRNGLSYDTSMGLTPLEGLVMASRSGDLDPGVLIFLAQQLGYSVDDLDKTLNKQSGLLGITGHKDLRAILEGAQNNNHDCQTAIDVFIHRLRKYIGAYMLQLEGNIDAIVFTAGIGENSALIRQMALARMENFGVVLDTAKNESGSGKVSEIQADSSKTKIWVIPTDEEWQIAEEARILLQA